MSRYEFISSFWFIYSRIQFDKVLYLFKICGGMKRNVKRIIVENLKMRMNTEKKEKERKRK